MATQAACPYVVLSVSREASVDDIRKSYKRLAILHHPDKNEGKPEATAMFQKISAAYAILSDEDKRRHYDMTGSLDGEEFEGGDMDDLMQMFFSTMGGSMFGGNMFGGNMFFEASFEDSDFDDYEQDISDVLPALFCEHFITEEESNDSRPKYRCTLCESVMRSEEAAESHYVNNHPSLMEKFISVLEKMELDDDIEELLDYFVNDVRSGKITEKKKRKPIRRKPKNPIVPNT